jgi:hypothetical protein
MVARAVRKEEGVKPYPTEAGSWADRFILAHDTGKKLPKPPYYDKHYHNRTEAIKVANNLWEEYKRDL